MVEMYKIKNIVLFNRLFFKHFLFKIRFVDFARFGLGKCRAPSQQTAVNVTKNINNYSRAAAG